MKKFLGLVSLAALIGAQAPVFADVKTAVVDKVMTEQGAQAIEAAGMILRGGIKSSADLAGKELAGVLVAQGSEGIIFQLASPLVAALKANPKMVLTERDFSRLAQIATKAELIPTAAIATLVEAVTEHGSLDATTVQAELDETTGEDVSNSLPGKIAGLPADAVLENFRATTDADQAAFNETAASEEAQTVRAEAVKLALTVGPASCSSSNVSFCAEQSKMVVQKWVRAGYNNSGKPALVFLSNLLQGFPEEKNAAPAEQYRAGGINALSMLAPMTAAGPVTDLAAQPLDGCFRRGNAAVTTLAN